MKELELLERNIRKDGLKNWTHRGHINTVDGSEGRIRQSYVNGSQNATYPTDNNVA